MRVSGMLAPGDERGAVAVFVAICMVVLLGFVALVADLGNLWQTRRHMITTTDAAALAAAGAYAVGDAGCDAEAASWVAANFASASLTDCAPRLTGSGGYVTVDADVAVDQYFSPVLGLPVTQPVSSTTTAGWGPAAGVSGLRPFGLCAQHPAFAGWVGAGQPDDVANGTVRRVTYAKDNPAHCGGNAPGNWGIMDFDGGSNSTAEHRQWVDEGYEAVVTAPVWISGDTGAFGNASRLDRLMGETFAIPIFDGVRGTGANTEFRVVGFAGTKLVGHRSTSAADDRYLDVQFTSMLVSGSCCGGPDFGLRAIFICGVDDSFDPRECDGS